MIRSRVVRGSLVTLSVAAIVAVAAVVPWKSGWFGGAQPSRPPIGPEAAVAAGPSGSPPHAPAPRRTTTGRPRPARQPSGVPGAPGTTGPPPTGRPSRNHPGHRHPSAGIRTGPAQATGSTSPAVPGEPSHPTVPPSTDVPAPRPGQSSSQATTGDPEPEAGEPRPVRLGVAGGVMSVDMTGWGDRHGGDGDLNSTADGLVAVKGARLAVVAVADWATCSAVRTDWQEAIPYQALRQGTQLCGRSAEGRVTALKVTSMPSEADPYLGFDGLTWHHSQDGRESLLRVQGRA